MTANMSLLFVSGVIIIGLVAPSLPLGLVVSALWACGCLAVNKR